MAWHGFVWWYELAFLKLELKLELELKLKLKLKLKMDVIKEREEGGEWFRWCFIYGDLFLWWWGVVN